MYEWWQVCSKEEERWTHIFFSRYAFNHIGSRYLPPFDNKTTLFPLLLHIRSRYGCSTLQTFLKRISPINNTYYIVKLWCAIQSTKLLLIKHWSLCLLYQWISEWIDHLFVWSVQKTIDDGVCILESIIIIRPFLSCWPIFFWKKLCH